MTTATAPQTTPDLPSVPDDAQGEGKKDYTKMTLRQMLNDQGMINDLGRAMPKHCKPDRMARIAITALTRTPDLALCTKASFFKCLLDLSQWGLEPDGRRAHLIPFKRNKGKANEYYECTLIFDYKGLAELAYRSGVVKSVHADVIREGDLFEYSAGQVHKHVPHFLRRDKDKPKDQGEVYAVYCVVELLGGVSKAEVMSVDDVEAIKERSQGWIAYKNGWSKSTPWATDWPEMAKKTVFRRTSKWIPLSAEIHEAFERDDDRVIDSTSKTITIGGGDVGGHLMNLLGDLGDQPRPDDDENQDAGEEDANQDPDAGKSKTLGDVGKKAAAQVAGVKGTTEAPVIKGTTTNEVVHVNDAQVVGVDKAAPGGDRSVATVVSTNGGPPSVPESLVDFANAIALPKDGDKLQAVWDEYFAEHDHSEQEVAAAQTLFDFYDSRIRARAAAAPASTAISPEAQQYIMRFKNSKTQAGVKKIMSDAPAKFSARADLDAINDAGAARLAEVAPKS